MEFKLKGRRGKTPQSTTTTTCIPPPWTDAAWHTSNQPANDL
jgi:hypothetical protein